MRALPGNVLSSECQTSGAVVDSALASDLRCWSAACQASLQRLSPDEYFPEGKQMSRSAVRVWEACLKSELVKWASQYGAAGLLATKHVLAQLQAASDWGCSKTLSGRPNHPLEFYRMLRSLDQQEMLPMLTFSFDRTKCEMLAGMSAASHHMHEILCLR